MGPKPCRPLKPSHSGPRTDFPDNTVTGWLGLEGQWRRIRTFDRQIMSLMLYPTELSVAQTAGVEPATSGSKSGALPLSYIRDPNPRNGAVHSGGKAGCAGGDESSNRCARFGFRDRERAYRPCDGLSQAALSRRIWGFLQPWHFGNNCNRRLHKTRSRQKVTRPSTLRPSPCGSTTTASPSRGATPVSATMFSRWVTSTRLSEPE